MAKTKTYEATVKVLINGSVWKVERFHVKATTIAHAIDNAGNHVMAYRIGSGVEQSEGAKTSMSVEVQELPEVKPQRYVAATWKR